MKRVENLQKILKEQDLDGIFLTKETNIRYMTGFTGSESFALISQNNKVFITDSRYTEQAQNQCAGFEIVKWRSPLPLPETIKSVCEKLGIKKLGFEKGFMAYDMYERMKSVLSGIDFIGTSGLVERLRIVKEEQEIEYLKKAAGIADAAFKQVLNYVKAGVTERDVEREFQYLVKKNGGEDIGFSSIIASGKNSSMPHAIPGDKKIEDGDFVTFDIGALYNGYRSDMTRTIVIGHASDKQKKVYETVKCALEAGTNAVRAGASGKTPHFVAKDIIDKSGIGGVFEYGVGHGIGLDIHENPFMGVYCEYMLEANNVLTVEPGIYLPGWGGVRIEDSMVVKEDGCEVITQSPRELIIV